MMTLTSGIIEKIKIQEDNQRDIFQVFQASLKNNNIISMVNKIKGKAIKKCEIGENGIYENYIHSIVMATNFIKKGIKLLKVRNNWGSESVWTGSFGNNSEDWEKNKEIAQKLLHNQKNKISEVQSNFFIKYEDFI